MPNTIKTLEEARFWALVGKYNLSLDNENYDDLQAFAREIQNSTLDACREKAVEADLNTFSDGHIYGGDKMRELIITAIDSLRPEEGKESV